MDSPNQPPAFEEIEGEDAMTMTRAEFTRYYEAWGVDDRLSAELEAATVSVPGERVVVVAFPLGDSREWTLRLESDRPSFSDDAVVIGRVGEEEGR